MRADNANVTHFDDALKNIVKKLLATMYSDHGVGLAAPQVSLWPITTFKYKYAHSKVGINQRLLVFNEYGEKSQQAHELVLINPVIISHSNDTNIDEESCLSFPFIGGDVKRYNSVTVQYQNIDNITQKVQFFGMPARIFQHEYDHLDKV